MNANPNASEPAPRRPTDPLLKAADAALRRAALKAQERARTTAEAARTRSGSAS